MSAPTDPNQPGPAMPAPAPGLPTAMPTAEPGQPWGPPPPGAVRTDSPAAPAYWAPTAPAYPVPPAPIPPGFVGAPQPRRRRKWPWITAAVVIVIIVAAIVIGFVFGRKGSGSPQQAAQRFWSAVAAHDLNKAEQYACNTKRVSRDAEFRQFTNAVTGFDLGTESGTGNRRVIPVTVHLSLAGEQPNVVVQTTLTKSTGQWYVCDLGRATLATP
jgi:flagellar basal body-associated protein FliL